MSAENEDRDTDEGGAAAHDERGPRAPHRVRLPGFLIEEGEDVGAGDAIKRLTYKMGVKHSCAGCERRAAALNRWMRFSR